MTFLLFLLGFIFFAAFLRRGESPEIREAVIKASLVLGAWIVAVTEAASAADMLTRGLLAALYALAVCGCLAFLFATLRMPSWERVFSRISASCRSLDGEERLLAIFCGVIALSTLIDALFAAPNNYDSMAYHMGRVAMWVHHSNVKYFTTWNGKQNFDSPFAEFAVLHLQLLCGSDRFANLVQWQAFLLGAIGASLIAREFGQTRRFQILSALVVMTAPMAILQSTSTQNDLVAAALCLSFALFMLRWLRTAAAGPVIFAGIGLGLAVLSKPTSNFWCLPLGLLLAPCSRLLKEKAGRLRWLANLALILAVALSLNTGVFTRNWQTYHSLLADPSPESYTVAHPSLYSLFSVGLRNIALHFRTPAGAVNNLAARFVHFALGNRINDPASTYSTSSMKFNFTRNMDDASNPLHLLFAGLALALLPWIRVRRRWQLICYGGSIVIGNILFSLLLRWQPWGSRLQMAFFLLSAPVIAMAIGALSRRLPRMPVSLLTAATVCVLAFLFGADMRDDVVFWAAAGALLWMSAQARPGKIALGIGAASVALLAAAYYCFPLSQGSVRIFGAAMLAALFCVAMWVFAKAQPPSASVTPFAFVFFVYAISFALVNPDHPVVPYHQECVFTSPRFWQYCRYHKDRYADYRAATALALEQGGGDIGLYLRGDDPEYLFWVLAGTEGVNRPPSFRNIGVTGRWADTGPAHSPPNIILATKLPADGRLLGRGYSAIFQSSSLYVLKLQNATR